MQHRDSPVEIRVRAIEPRDLQAVFEFQCEPASNEMAGTKPRSRETFFEVWGRNLVDPAIHACVIEIDGPHEPEIVGNIACFQMDGRDCVGYWIAQRHWGRGFASQALRRFLTMERRRPLHATAACDNAASRHILEKCGFRCVGCHMGEETDRYVAREVAEYLLD